MKKYILSLLFAFTAIAFNIASANIIERNNTVDANYSDLSNPDSGEKAYSLFEKSEEPLAIVPRNDHQFNSGVSSILFKTINTRPTPNLGLQATSEETPSSIILFGKNRSIDYYIYALRKIII